SAEGRGAPFHASRQRVRMMQLDTEPRNDVPSASMAPAVRTSGIGMVYPGVVRALDDVSIDFPRGKLITLLGPSGCGKTTLLKIIAGLQRPTEGTVEVNGRPIDGPGPDRALVFQDFALLPWATVIRNVAFGLELQGMPRGE